MEEVQETVAGSDVSQSEKRSRTILYSAVLISMGTVAAVLGPTLPALAGHLNVPLETAGVLFTARSGGAILGSFTAGRVYNRVSGHPFMAAILLTAACLMTAVPLIHSFPLLFAALMMLGFTAGASHVGANTLLVWTHRGGVGPYLNALHFSFGIGSFLAPVAVGRSLALEMGIDGAYLFLAALMVPAVPFLFRLPSPARPSIRELKDGNRTDNGLLALLVIFFLLYVGAEISLGGWLYSYAVELGLASATAAADLTSVFWGALTLGRLAAIPIAARYAPRHILFVDLIGAMAIAGLMLLTSNLSWSVWVGAAGLGAFMASIFPTTMMLAAGRMRLTGRETSWFLIGTGLGGMSIPWLCGVLFRGVGPVMVIVTVLAVLATAFGMLLLILRRSERKIGGNLD